MRPFLLTIFSTFLMFLLGCAHPAIERQLYVGEITQVRQAEGTHYSLIKGEQPLTLIFVRVRDPQNSSGVIQLKIALLDFYTPESYGGPHDLVSFRYLKRLPLRGDTWFDELIGYKIVTMRQTELRH